MECGIWCRSINFHLFFSVWHSGVKMTFGK